MPHNGDSPDPGLVAERDQRHADALQLLRDSRAYGLVVVPKDGGIQSRGTATDEFDMKCIAAGLAEMLDAMPGVEYEESLQQAREMREYDEREERLRRLAEGEEAAA